MNDFVDQGYQHEFGLTKTQAQQQGVCVNCKQEVQYDGLPGEEGAIYTEAGRREYWISAMCETCFDEMFAE